jgi:hypothetical protein
MNELSTSQQPQPAPESWIERIFNRMSGMYGSKFAEAWKGVAIETVKETWSEALAGFGGEEIKRGLSGCLSREWPPTLPEFIKLCRPHMDHEVAFEIAAKQLPLRDAGQDKWPEAAIYWAAAKMSYDIQHGNYASLKHRWRNELDQCRTDAVAGLISSEIPKRPERIKHEPVAMSDEERQKRIERLKEELGAFGITEPQKTLSEAGRQRKIDEINKALEKTKPEAL